MAEQETYLAIPYPLPDAIRQKLIDAGNRAIAKRRKSESAAEVSTIEVESIEEDIRDALGVEATRTY